MSSKDQNTFTFKASLILGLAFVFILSCQKAPTRSFKTSEIPPYHTIHSQASYPGGVKAWNDFLRENIKYPKTQLTIEGKVLLNTTIDSTGRVSEVKVIRGLHPLFDEEAKRLVLASGKWNPATYQGKPVKESIAFFIHFRYK